MRVEVRASGSLRDQYLPAKRDGAGYQGRDGRRAYVRGEHAFEYGRAPGERANDAAPQARAACKKQQEVGHERGTATDLAMARGVLVEIAAHERVGDRR